MPCGSWWISQSIPRMDSFEGSLAPVSCLEEGAEPCPRASQCRTLNFWKGLDETISRYARSYSVADLMWNGQTDNDYVI